MDLRLLEKFFNKQCTPEEVAEVLRWFNTEEEPHTLSAIEEYWQHFEDTENNRLPSEVNTQLEKIHHHLLNQEAPFQVNSSRTATIRKSVFNNFGFALRVAAIILIAIVASVTLQYAPSPNGTTVQEVAYVTKSNPDGQKTTILLEDGSKVILNAASTLKYPEHFSATDRGLQLQGEAFFEVAKDTKRPFTVVANGIATTALGTSFNIRAYENEKHISIALATGKVKVESSEATGNAEVYQLSPGESLTYDIELVNYKKELFDPKAQLAWKDGVIYFNNASFQQVIDKLSRWYGVRFEIEKHPEKSWKYTGEFHKENLENVLQSISYAKKFDFEITRDTVTLVFTNQK